jgi:hypothetical protein
MLNEDRTSLERYLDGTAHRPFIYRVLVPKAILLLKAVIPDAVVRPLATPWMYRFLREKATSGADPVIYFYLDAILVLFLIGYAIVGERLWVRLFPRSRRPELVPIGLLVLLVPFIAEHHGHIYDFSVLFFIMTLLYMIVTEQHAIYLAIFTVSLFNKETTCLAAVAYACYFADRLPRKTFVLMMLAQAAAFLLVYYGLKLHYAGNPGRGMEHWVREQLHWFFSLSLSDYLAYVGGMLLIAYRWPTKPLVLRRSAWMLVPHIALCLVGAYPGEFRNLYESLPLLSLFILHSVQDIVIGSSPDHQPHGAIA